jgi:hypothetical protein
MALFEAGVPDAARAVLAPVVKIPIVIRTIHPRTPIGRNLLCAANRSAVLAVELAGSMKAALCSPS